MYTMCVYLGNNLTPKLGIPTIAAGLQRNILEGDSMGAGVLQAALLLVIVVYSVRRRTARTNDEFFWVYCVFFLSGVPALIYQIVWERALFTIYGVNVESVTVVVTGFMIGLGLGSLVGGWLSRMDRAPLLMLFAGAELGTATYGLFSLRIFHYAALYSAGASLGVTALLSFGLLLIPTMLMGSTLPMLVDYLVRISHNVGRSFGLLYFANTLGSAAACFLAAGFTMRVLGESGLGDASGPDKHRGLRNGAGVALLRYHNERSGDQRELCYNRS